jgi:hypothetical protein
MQCHVFREPLHLHLMSLAEALAGRYCLRVLGWLFFLYQSSKILSRRYHQPQVLTWLGIFASFLVSTDDFLCFTGNPMSSFTFRRLFYRILLFVTGTWNFAGWHVWHSSRVYCISVGTSSTPFCRVLPLLITSVTKLFLISVLLSS